MRSRTKSGRLLGVMTTRRKRETQPSYARLLVRFGLLNKRADLQQAWGTWQRVCADSEVIRLTQKRQVEKTLIPSVAAPYREAAHVLAAMSERQLAALRQRVGVQL